MVFQSFPVYHPNWQHQQPNQLLGGGGNEQQTLQLPPLAQPTSQPPGGQTRPGSMAERARMAKIPQPEAALKCPRCESTNTKFCYYNNYSLSQPRHFCKTCRRYWTRGGALRNVPVGGGCRRNKKIKSRAKSHAAAVTSSGSMAATSGLGSLPPLPPTVSAQLPFLPPLQNLSEYGDLEFQAGTSNGGTGVGQIMLPNGLLLGEQWRVQQFPFLTNMGTTHAAGLLQLDQSDHEGTNTTQGLNLMSRNLLGLSGNYDHNPLWNANNSNGWSDASGLASSSITAHHQ